jgi:hypothetical protein
LERTLLTGRRDTWRDWLFMALLALGLMTLAMLPFVILMYFGDAILKGLGLHSMPLW